MLWQRLMRLKSAKLISQFRFGDGMISHMLDLVDSPNNPDIAIRSAYK